MSDVLFIYGSPEGPHPSHREFINVIHADMAHVYFGEWGGRLKRCFLSLKHSLKYSDEYKYYILESYIPVFPAALKKFLKNRNIKLIELFCDEAVMNFHKKLPHYGWMEVIAHKWASKYLDAGISVSPMIKELAVKILKIPVEVARPYIVKERYEKLVKIKPDLSCGVISILGGARKNHGADILVKAFKLVERNNNKLKLIIGGKGWPKKWEKGKIIVPGFIENIEIFFEQTSLFVYPARASAYPVVTLEAMRAGVPVIVSENTGTKELVEIVESRFKEEFNSKAKLIVKADPIDVAKSINWYFSLNEDERKFLSDEFRRLTKPFNPTECAENFKRAFEKIKQIIES